MRVKERWRELDDYPGYAISDEGQIMNMNTDLMKHPSKNQQDIMMVNFSIRNQQQVRSVALLVATTFLDDIPRPSHFDTPIHLDGNKENCRVENLAWRPRWFAVKYHKQFSPWERTHRYGFHRPVMIVETEEVFPTSWEAAIKYGLLDFEILIATQNQTVVFPINQRFQVIED